MTRAALTILQAVKVISSRHTTKLQVPSTTLDAEKKIQETFLMMIYLKNLMKKIKNQENK